MQSWLCGQIHHSVVRDPAASLWHQSFVGAHFLAAALILAFLPLGVVSSDMPAEMGAGLVVGIVALLASGLIVSKTGRLDAGLVLSSATGLACTLWGGALFGTLMLLPLLIVPVEAVLMGSFRAILLIFTMTVGTIGLIDAGIGPTSGLVMLSSGEGMGEGMPVALAALLYLGTVGLRLKFLKPEHGEALVETDDISKLLTDHMTDLITRHDKRGDVVLATEVSERVLGVEPSHLHGTGFFNTVHVADRPTYLKAISDALIHQDPVRIECRMSRTSKDTGRPIYIWAEMRCAPDLRSDEDAVIVATRDISVRKEQELALIEASKAAKAASVSSIQFLANMSHELRTPLNAVIGFADILKQELFGPLSPPRYKDYAKLIHESGEHLLALVNDLLDVSRIESGKFPIVPEPLDPSLLVKGSCKLMSSVAEVKKINLMVLVETGLPEMIADPRACKQMVLNLLSNAVKFSPEGADIRINAKRSGYGLEISVQDYGPGMEADDLPKLGQPFFQCDNSYERHQEGAGLGLSIVRGLVELHHGELEFQSEPGIGTTAILRLPLDCSKERDTVEDLKQKAVSLNRHVVSASRQRASGERG